MRSHQCCFSVPVEFDSLTCLSLSHPLNPFFLHSAGCNICQLLQQMPLVALPIALSSFSCSSLTQPLVESLSPAVSTLFFFLCTAHTMRLQFYLPAAICLPCAFWSPEGLEHVLTHLTKGVFYRCFFHTWNWKTWICKHGGRRIEGRN